MSNIKVDGCHFENNGTAISVSDGVQLEVSSTTFIRNGKAIDVRDAPPLIKQLGLPETVSPDDFVAVMHAMQQQPQEAREGVLKSSKIWPLIQNCANVAQIVGTLVALVSS
ncbi:hypothetical protein [Burkholderia sp. RS02]|uniref:hypothetical protein n=1 Tax=unclassified Burkholderia TaxID=2613784 RepID=UPI003218B4A6